MSAGPGILDPDIREALVGGRSGLHADRNGALVIHELGLAHAKRRVDVTVIDGDVHGYEIKSAKDRLDRLRGQLHVFTQALHRLTLVVATKHLKCTLEIVPTWCGVIEVRADSEGHVDLLEVRKAERNPSVNPFILAHLLWRSEVQDILSKYGARPVTLRAPRAELYKLLVEKTSDDQLVRMIKDAHGEAQILARSFTTIVMWWLIVTLFQRVRLLGPSFSAAH